MKTVLDFSKKKKLNQKITMLTCYDYTMARLLDKTKVDSLLVGDSVAQVMYGHPNTLNATTRMIATHTAAVVRGAPSKFVVADMPFLSFRKGMKHTMDSVHLLMQAGAHAVKIEGVQGHEKIIEHIVQSGVPVMGHLGLTPQSIHQFGGPKIQGRSQDGADRLKNEALILQQLGCFSVVLECIPSALSSLVTESLFIPTIGIGAGPSTSGQILVTHDMLGMNLSFQPKFLKRYSEIEKLTIDSVDKYVQDVEKDIFPTLEHSYE